MGRIIWSNDGNQINREIEYRREEAIELTGKAPSDEELLEMAAESIGMWYQDELANLDRPLDGRVLVIADLGLWNGRRLGYKILGNNLNNIMSPGGGHDEYTVGIDKGKLVGLGKHHDGTNRYEFREIREGMNLNNLLDSIYSGRKPSRRKINYYTKSLVPYVREIYGW